MDDFLRYDVATTVYAEIGDIPIQRFKARETELRDQWRLIFNRESFDLSVAVNGVMQNRHSGKSRST